MTGPGPLGQRRGGLPQLLQAQRRVVAELQRLRVARTRFRGPLVREAAQFGQGTAVLAALSGLVPFFWPAGILGLIGLALGLSAKGRVKRGEATNKGAAVAGLVLGPVSLILSVVGAVITFKDVGDAVDEIGKATTGSSAAKKRRTRPGAAPQRTRRTTRPARCGYGARPVRVRDRLRPGTAPGRSPV